MAACPHAGDPRHACMGPGPCGHCQCGRPIDEHYDIETKVPHCPRK